MRTDTGQNNPPKTLSHPVSFCSQCATLTWTHTAWHGVQRSVQTKATEGSLVVRRTHQNEFQTRPEAGIFLTGTGSHLNVPVTLPLTLAKKTHFDRKSPQNTPNSLTVTPGKADDEYHGDNIKMGLQPYCCHSPPGQHVWKLQSSINVISEPRKFSLKETELRLGVHTVRL